MIQLFLSHSKPIKNNVVVPFLNDLSLLGIPYWFDREFISSGDDIYARIVEGINVSSHCVAFIDNTYLHSQWPLKELKLFYEKEEKEETSLIIPVYCGIQKETVYKTIPWLENRAFEIIEQKTYGDGEREKIVCRVVNRLLDEMGIPADISTLEQLLLHKSFLPFYDIFNVLYNSKYYLSSDLQLACIELCNILALFGVACNVFDINQDNFEINLFKLPYYIKEIALKNPDYLNYDFAVVLKRCINYVSKYLLHFLNS